jgi:hypothetical protein
MRKITLPLTVAYDMLFTSSGWIGDPGVVAAMANMATHWSINDD